VGRRSRAGGVVEHPPRPLELLGLGGLLGNRLSGRATDRDHAGVGYVAATVLSALMPFRGAASGVVTAAVISPLQGMILEAAGKQSTMAVAVNVAAILAGHAVGASAGGFLIELTPLHWKGFRGAVRCDAARTGARDAAGRRVRRAAESGL